MGFGAGIQISSLYRAELPVNRSTYNVGVIRFVSSLPHHMSVRTIFFLQGLVPHLLSSGTVVCKKKNIFLPSPSPRPPLLSPLSVSIVAAPVVAHSLTTTTARGGLDPVASPSIRQGGPRSSARRLRFNDGPLDPQRYGQAKQRWRVVNARRQVGPHDFFTESTYVCLHAPVSAKILLASAPVMVEPMLQPSLSLYTPVLHHIGHVQYGVMLDSASHCHVTQVLGLLFSSGV